MQTQTLNKPDQEQTADTYDGEWDSCNDDFVTRIPGYLDIMDSTSDDWHDIRSPGKKDYLAEYQITAEGW